MGESDGFDAVADDHESKQAAAPLLKSPLYWATQLVLLVALILVNARWGFTGAIPVIALWGPLTQVVRQRISTHQK